MSTLSILPLDYDIQYILNKMTEAGVTNHYGFAEEPDGIHLRYHATDYDTVQEILDTYPVDYANDVRRKMLIFEATNERYERQKFVPNFHGQPLPADDITIARIIAALDLMDRNPDLPRVRNWKVIGTTWATLDYNTIAAMGRAIGIHIQACFDHEKALHEAIVAAADINELAEIDVRSGWPT